MQPELWVMLTSSVRSSPPLTITAKMKPLPGDDKNPLGDGKSNADHLILWLAFKEARVLNASPAK